MRRIHFALSCLLVLVLSSCHSGKKSQASEAPAAEAESPSYVMVAMKRSACFGKCPVYEVRFYTDGTIEYIGKMNVPRIGHFRAHMRPEEVEALRQKIHEVGFWDFSPMYPDDGTIVTDLPTTTITVRVGDMMKEVREKHGAPRALKDFERYLDELLEGRTWEQVLESE